MNDLHRRPFPNEQERARLSAVADRVDAAAYRTPAVAAPAPQVPSYGSPQRDAINSVIDNVLRDVTEKIAALRKQLDALEQQVLHGAADAKHTLNEQIAVCVRVNDEINHMAEVIDEIAQRFLKDANAR